MCVPASTQTQIPTHTHNTPHTHCTHYKCIIQNQMYYIIREYTHTFTLTNSLINAMNEFERSSNHHLRKCTQMFFENGANWKELVYLEWYKSTVGKAYSKSEALEMWNERNEKKSSRNSIEINKLWLCRRAKELVKNGASTIAHAPNQKYPCVRNGCFCVWIQRDKYALLW